MWKLILGFVVFAAIAMYVLMKAGGEPALADRAFREVVKIYGRRRDRLDAEEQEWLAQAERNLT